MSDTQAQAQAHPHQEPEWRSMKNPALTVCFVGVGYVGGPTMAVIADKAHDYCVIGMDLSESHIEKWRSDNLPIYEPGLIDVVKRRRGKNLFFTTNAKDSIDDADVIFVCVGTPTKSTGVGAGYASDLIYIEAAARSIAKYATKSKIVVEKSTVPVQTSSAIEVILKANVQPGVSCVVLSNPEFLAEGTAISDLIKPDRVLIGGPVSDEGQAAQEKVVGIYARWVPRERIITTNQWSSELSKLVANAFLAQRISSINSISSLCEASGADVKEVARAIGMDTRIGPKFLNASVGFGGSCFQKDILNLVYLCRAFHLEEPAEYWRQVIAMNDWQMRRFTHRIVSTMFNTIANKRICVLGFAFKKDTGDTRESPAIKVCSALLNDRAKLSIYDPKVSRAQIEHDLKAMAGNGNGNGNGNGGATIVDSNVEVFDDAYTAAKGAHALVILTEWDEFRTLDYQRMYDEMLKPAFLFDGRIIVDLEHVKKIGYEAHQLGAKSETGPRR